MNKPILTALVTAIGVAAALGFLCLLADAAAAQTTYGWRTDDGVLAFTDDLDRVPARYIERAQIFDLRDLEPRLTVPAVRIEAETAKERLNFLRRFNQRCTLVATPGYSLVSCRPYN